MSRHAFSPNVRSGLATLWGIILAGGAFGAVVAISLDSWGPSIRGLLYGAVLALGTGLPITAAMMVHGAAWGQGRWSSWHALIGGALAGWSSSWLAIPHRDWGPSLIAAATAWGAAGALAALQKLGPAASVLSEHPSPDAQLASDSPPQLNYLGRSLSAGLLIGLWIGGIFALQATPKPTYSIRDFPDASTEYLYEQAQ